VKCKMRPILNAYEGNVLKLSKSRFIIGLQCPKRLWLSVHQHESATPPSAQTQSIFDQGHEVGLLAQQLYPDGVTVVADPLHMEDALKATEKAVEDGASILYEAGAEYQGVWARADILAKNPDGSWDMIEVKSSTGVHDEYMGDLALQRFVFEGAGYPIRRTYLCHINNTYVRHGEIEINKLFARSDVTPRVSALLPKIPDLVKGQRGVLALKNEPPRGPGKHCEDPHECDFKDYCWKVLPKGSVFELVAWKGLAERLYGVGIVYIKDIPESTKLTAAQRDQVSVVKSGKPIWKKAEVQRFLKNVKYPVYCLDFEAFMQAVPPFDETKPYGHIPFQFSIHRLDSPGAKPVHIEFLAEGEGDPREKLCEELLAGLGTEGTLFSYSPYETRIMRELGRLFPAREKQLQSAISRVLDLAAPFRGRAVVCAGFGGSYSIKKVLPTLVPSMSYDQLEVGEGMAAVGAFNRIRDPKTTGEEKAAIRKALLVYCGQDTMAMVKLFEVLSKSVL
jgi:hypothetical protein